jgi:hypothetical protein
MIYLSNAFSLGMLNNPNVVLDITELTDENVKAMLQMNDVKSVVGHQSTADFISAVLGIDVPMNREQVSLSVGDTIIVFQLQARLPEGKVLTKEEINQIPYKWICVDVLPDEVLYGG